MKNNPKVHKQKQYKDDKFAEKIICQLIATTVLFFAVFVNSKLPYKVCETVNDKIRYYLTSNVDFKKVANNARMYIEDFIGQIQALPASTEVAPETADSE